MELAAVALILLFMAVFMWTVLIEGIFWTIVLVAALFFGWRESKVKVSRWRRRPA